MSDEDAPVLEPLSKDRQKDLDIAVSGYEEGLRYSPEAVSYLLSRGFTREAVERFRLGVVAEPTVEHQRFRNMLAIPYLDKTGMPLTVRFRCLEDHSHREHRHGKYNSITGDPGRMFNIRAVHDADDVIHLTEGELDCVVLSQLGYYAVAMPGATSFKARHRRMLAGFSRIYVWGDPDEAGGEFVTKVMNALRQAIPITPKGGDVNEVLLLEGEDAIRELVEQAERSHA